MAVQRCRASAALPIGLVFLFQNQGLLRAARCWHALRSDAGHLLHCPLALFLYFRIKGCFSPRAVGILVRMPSKLQYCVYVLLSMHDNGFYIGFTTDLQRRLTEHFHGESKATAPRRPFRLIFCEYFFSKEDAERREGYLKTTAGRRGLKLILRETLQSRVWD